MKKLFYTIASIGMLAFVACNNQAKKDDSADAQKDSIAAPATDTASKSEAAAPPDSAAMAKAWQDFMTPGPMHKWMASMDGKWDGESISYMNDQAMPASKVQITNKMVLNGLYQQSTYSGMMMGAPFEGMGTLAYDNARKKFVSTWMDNMGSGIVWMEGDYDEASKTLNLTGSMTDALTGKPCPLRQVQKIVDDKHQVMEMYATQNGKEGKMMEVKMTKK